MMIRHITIRDFGAVSFYDAALTPSLNIIDSHYISEISAAIALVLCSKVQPAVPSAWIHCTTGLTAEVILETGVYTVRAIPCRGQLTLTVTDENGAEVTDAYAYMLSHCPEQDRIDNFDGQDQTLPMRLFRYRNCADAPENISDRTDNLTDTKTFRSHLLGYIKAFPPEPIHCQKAYLVALNPKGEFQVVFPGIDGDVSLSETEEKLFRYICFLNVAEFWAGFEKIRDLHHEKKPLVIQNFLEFLDASADIRALVARTHLLQRQIIILTLPLSEDMKKKWQEDDPMPLRSVSLL